MPCCSVRENFAPWFVIAAAVCGAGHAFAHDDESFAYAATAMDPATQALLYRESWLVTAVEAVTTGIHIRYTTPAGQHIGSKHLRFAAPRAWQPEVDAQAFAGECSAQLHKAQGHWRLQTQSSGMQYPKRETRSIAPPVVIDATIIPWLAKKRHAILAGRYRSVEQLFLQDKTPRKLYLQAQAYARDGQEMIRIEAFPRLLGFKQAPVVVLDVSRVDGQPLRYEGPSPLHCRPFWPGRVVLQFTSSDGGSRPWEPPDFLSH